MAKVIIVELIKMSKDGRLPKWWELEHSILFKVLTAAEYSFFNNYLNKRKEQQQ